MRFENLCDYFTLAEVAERWEIKPESLMLRRAIMRGVLKPCLWVPDTEMHRIELDNDGRPVHSTHAGDPVTATVGGWIYPWAAFQTPTAPFAALFQFVTDQCALDGANIFAPATPVSLADILSDAVVMASDLQAAEAELKRGASHEPSTKELNKQLCMISTLLADGYGYDPRRPNSQASEISRAARAHGISLSDGTALKYMRQAFEQFPPSYMAEPLPDVGKPVRAETTNGLDQRAPEPCASSEPERLAA